MIGLVTLVLLDIGRFPLRKSFTDLRRNICVFKVDRHFNSSVQSCVAPIRCRRLSALCVSAGPFFASSVLCPLGRYEDVGSFNTVLLTSLSTVISAARRVLKLAVNVVPISAS